MCLTFATLWTVAHWAPLSIVFSRQEYWSKLPFPPPGNLPDPGMEPASPALQADFLPLSPLGILQGANWSLFPQVMNITDTALHLVQGNTSMNENHCWYCYYLIRNCSKSSCAPAPRSSMTPHCSCGGQLRSTLATSFTCPPNLSSASGLFLHLGVHWVPLSRGPTSTENYPKPHPAGAGSQETLQPCSFGGTIVRCFPHAPCQGQVGHSPSPLQRNQSSHQHTPSGISLFLAFFSCSLTPEMTPKHTTCISPLAHTLLLGNPKKNLSLVARMAKNPPVMQETWFRSLGGEDPLKEGMATHSSILVWRIPWMEEPGGLQSMGS